jgi:glycosyltransferase involved in cell wall biosynthesis
MKNLKFANNLLKEKKYKEALSEYKKILENSPQLSKLIDFNIAICTKNLKNSRPSPIGELGLTDLYEEVKQAISRRQYEEVLDGPLVTVVMTSHNVEEYIEQAVISVLSQRYKNKELIVVDDCSTDSTVQILERLRLSVSNLKVIQLNANLGTYYAKNYAINLAKGDYIFFQDSDDISHPARLSLGMKQLLDDDLIATRCCYSRVLFPEERVFLVNGLIKKLGLITVGYKKSIFSEIGYFNNTSKASDDEFYNRARSCFPSSKFKDINLPLYYNTLREGSLFTDMFNMSDIKDRNIEQKPAASRLKYQDEFMRLHKNRKKEEFIDIFKFPILRDPLPVDPDMTMLTNPKIPVVFNVCTYPPRLEAFKKMLKSIENQADKINIFLDKYEVVPDFLIEMGSKVQVYLGADFGDLRDNGKFISTNQLYEDCYYLTVDDDIVYPPDYAHAMIQAVERYERKCAVGVHGVLIQERAEKYFGGYRSVYTFWKKLEKDLLVNNLGTGTMAIHSDLLRSINLKNFENPGMLDIYFSIYCKKNRIPMVAIKRPDLWLMEIRDDSVKASGTLFEEFSNSDHKQSQLVIDNAPWGYKSIDNILKEAKFSANVYNMLNAMLPPLRSALVGV